MCRCNVIDVYSTPWKFNSSPLKEIPSQKERLVFQGPLLLNFGDVHLEPENE